MVSLRKKTDIVFYKISAIGGLCLLVFVSLGVLLHDRLVLAMAALGDKLEAACGCVNHWSFANHPWLLTFLSLAAAIVLAFIVASLTKIIRLKLRTNKFVRDSLRNKKEKLSEKLRLVARPLGLEGRIVEIKDNNPVVFCFGLIKTKICISSSFIARLNSGELKAVLRHEQHHLINHETIKLFIIKTITAILFFIPGLKFLAEQYCILSEVSADEWAINNSPDKSCLAGAIYKVLELKENIVLKNNLAIASFSRITEERINRIADDTYVIRVNLVKSKFFINLILVSFVLFGFVFFAYSSKATITNSGEASCAAEHSQEHQGCQMLNHDQACKMQGQSILLDNVECSGASLNPMFYNKTNYSF